MPLESKIEAVLFYKAEPMKKRELAAFFDVTEEEITGALGALRDRLCGGVTLTETEDRVQLATASAASEYIEQLRKSELSRDIGKAGAETLAIVLYREPVTRSEIDMIRGVNSAFILRNLLVRGLLERIPHPTDKRQFKYRSTPELLAHLGITKKEELPEYRTISDAIDRYERETATQESVS